MSGSKMPMKELLGHLERLVQEHLPLWDLPQDARARLINVSENFTYLVEGAGGFRAVLRVHRENYHSLRAIECELAWADDLRKEGRIRTPKYILGKDGNAVQTGQVAGLQKPRFMVLFEYFEGNSPAQTGDMRKGFEDLGRLAAHCHSHVQTWPKPQPFERLTWDAEAVFGSQATWGDWRDAPEVTQAVKEVLERVERVICERLEAFGHGPERYDLIHADMRLANLLVDQKRTNLIDFDDCGWGWFMYDFAAAISFMEDDPRVPHLKSSWLSGYRSVRPLSEADEAEIPTFVMLRRMALLAWIGSHIEAPEPQALAPGFASVTADLGISYLRDIEL